MEASSPQLGGWETLILPVTVSVIWIVGTIGLLLRRDKEVIEKRGFEFVIVGGFFCVVGFWMMGIERAPIDMDLLTGCILNLWLQSFFIPMWLSPYIFRATYLDLQYQFNMKKLRPKEVNDKDFWFSKYPTMTRKRFFVAIHIGIWIVSIIVTAGVATVDTPENDDVAMNCGFDYTSMTDLAWSLLLIALGIFYVWRLWKTSDAYHLRTELKVFLWAFPLGYFGSAFAAFFSPDPSISFYIVFVCTLFSFGVSFFYPVYLSYRPEWNGKLSSSGSSINSSEEQRRMDSKELFRLCLNQPELLRAFTQYSAELWCAENIQFYTEVQNFRKTLEAGGSFAKAESIVELYIDPKAPTLVNLDEGIQKRTLEKMDEARRRKAEAAGEAKDEAEVVDPRMFDEAETSVMEQMRQDTFSKFKASKRLEKAWREAGLGELAVLGDDEKDRDKEKEKRRSEESRKSEERASDEVLSPTAAELLEMIPRGADSS